MKMNEYFASKRKSGSERKMRPSRGETWLKEAMSGTCPISPFFNGKAMAYGVPGFAEKILLEDGAIGLSTGIDKPEAYLITAEPAGFEISASGKILINGIEACVSISLKPGVCYKATEIMKKRGDQDSGAEEELRTPISLFPAEEIIRTVISCPFSVQTFPANAITISVVKKAGKIVLNVFHENGTIAGTVKITPTDTIAQYDFFEDIAFSHERSKPAGFFSSMLFRETPETANCIYSLGYSLEQVFDLFTDVELKFI